MSKRTDWFQKAKWGVFIHFLADDSVDSELWNNAVDGFDVDTLAAQLHKVSARYIFLTIGQNSGFYCSPNTEYDALCAPGRCSKRDLVLELAEALKPYEIDLMVYFTSGAPDKDALALRQLGWKTADRCAAFQEKWEAVIREWSLRWGPQVKGWWIDGCYFADEMYRHNDAPNFKSFSKAMRAGNPEAIVAWNPGVSYPPIHMDLEEDYTAGEINEPQQIDLASDKSDKVQFHFLSYLGTSWGMRPLRFTPAEIIVHTTEVTNYAGVVSWDVPLEKNGTLAEDVMAVLKPLGAEIDKTRGCDFGVPPKRVKHDFSFTRVPQEGEPGVASLILRNPWDIRIHDSISLKVEPHGYATMDIAVPIECELQPGEERSINIFIEKMVDKSGFETVEKPHILLRKSSDPRLFKYPLPVRKILRVPNLETLPTLENVQQMLTTLIPTPIISDGRKLAEIKLAVHDNVLIVAAEVNDMDPVRSLGIWQGSCIELFGSPVENPNINQFFALPETRDVSDLLLRHVKDTEAKKQELHTVPETESQFATRKTENGYSAFLIIPLNNWLGNENNEDGFYLDIVCSVPYGAQLARGALSGEERGNASTTDNYVQIAIV